MRLEHCGTIDNNIVVKAKPVRGVLPSVYILTKAFRVVKVGKISFFKKELYRRFG